MNHRWMDRAACADKPREWFFPPTGRTDNYPICDGCPVKAECYAYAAHHGCVGVWGGVFFPGSGRPKLRVS